MGQGEKMSTKVHFWGTENSFSHLKVFAETREKMPEYFPVPAEGRCESHPGWLGFSNIRGFLPCFFSLQLNWVKAAFIFVLSGKMWNLRNKS